MWGVQLSLGLWSFSSAISDPPPSVMQSPPLPTSSAGSGPRVTILEPRTHKSAKSQLGFLQPWVWESESPWFYPAISWYILSPGLQVLLPEYLRERFVAAALSYITCSSEGELVCKENDCWCKCSSTFPECNCPDADIQAMEDSLLQIQDSWATHNRQFEESGEQPTGPEFLPAKEK
jgi:hypothetical protein